MRIPSRGEIWFANLNPTAGREQQGARPVLVVSEKRFNRLRALLAARGMPVGAYDVIIAGQARACGLTLVPATCASSPATRTRRPKPGESR